MLTAFQPQGLTQVFSVTTTPTSAFQLSAATFGVRFQAEGQVHFAFGSSAGSSAISCAIPTTAVPANGIPLINSVEAFNIGQSAWLSLCSTAPGPTPVRVTGGFGV